MRKLKICGDEVHAPLDFKDSKGHIRGFNTSLTKVISNHLEIPIEIDLLPWSEAIDRFEKGEYDAIQGMSIGEERKQKYIMCEEYITAFHCIFSLKDRNINQHTDMSSFKIAVQENDVGVKLAREILGKNYDENIIVLSDQEKVLMSLSNGKVDIAICNKFIVMYFGHKLNILKKIRQVGNPINITKFSIAFHKKDYELAETFNKGLRQIKNNGMYEKIYNIWFENRMNMMEKQIIKNVNIGIICIDKMSRISAINEYAIKVLQNKAENLMYKIFYETELINKFSIDTIQEILDGVRNSYSVKKTMKINDEFLRFSVNYFSVYNENQDTTGVIINFKDITDNEVLKQVINQKNRMEPLSQLLLNVAHEVRNPLTCIKGFIDLLPDNYDDEDFRNSLLEHVPKQIDYMDRILTELLEYSKPVGPVTIEVNFKNFLESITESLKIDNRFIKKNLDLIIDVSQEFYIEVDYEQLRKIVTNILINAIDASFKNSTIKISSNCNDKHRCITIENNGEKIADSFLEKIFDPFETTKDKGTGLGLFICYNLMKENGGYINIENTSGGVLVSLVFQYIEK